MKAGERWRYNSYGSEMSFIVEYRTDNNNGNCFVVQANEYATRHGYGVGVMTCFSLYREYPTTNWTYLTGQDKPSQQ